MKIRIGIGSGAATAEPEELGHLVSCMEQAGCDSLWLPEVLTSPAPDPMSTLAYAAARTKRLKLGVTMVLPGRNPARLAKALATVDRLCGGRLLVTFVVGLNRTAELAALGVQPADRSDELDELMPLIRRLWSEDEVHHRGDRWTFDGVTISPKPLQDPLEIWLGGTSKAALRRCGQLADGWLPSLCSPKTAGDGRKEIERIAADAGRSISPEHFGVSIAYTRTPLSGGLEGRLGSGARRVDPALVPIGLRSLRELIERYIEVGFSKFVVRPIEPPRSWPEELAALEAEVLDLQS